MIMINAKNALHTGFLEITSTVYDDMRVPATNFQVGASAPDLAAFGPSGNLLAYAFAGTGAIVEQAFFNLQMSHKYKLGTNLIAHIHWAPTTADAGNVVWQLEYFWADELGTYGAPTTITITDASDGTPWKHQIADFPVIAASAGKGDSISSILVCRLFRDPAHASDTYEQDASVLEFDLHYQVDTIGSRGEHSKR